MSANWGRFDEIFAEVVCQGEERGRGPISPQLEALLRPFHAALLRAPIDRATLDAALVEVLTFLTTPEGRTDANCWAVDLFVFWTFELARLDLPDDDFFDIIRELNGALHDTVSSPEIARNFDATPEQLLERLQRLSPELRQAGKS